MNTKNNYIQSIKANTLIFMAFCFSLVISIKFLFLENYNISLNLIASYIPFCLTAGLIFTVLSSVFNNKNKIYLLSNIVISWLSSITIIEMINKI